MIDPLAAGLAAVRSGSPASAAAVFAAGLCTSVGPCVAPRYLALATLASTYRNPTVPTLAFVAGMLGAFMTLGFGAGAVGALWISAGSVYALLATALVLGGCYSLVRADPPAASSARCCAAPLQRPAGRIAQRSLGGIFLFGAASALIVSPCCTPVVTAIAATSAAIGKPVVGVALLTSFTIGHALPLLVGGSFTARLRRIEKLRIHGQAAPIVSGVLMLALGAYYGMLA